MKLLFGIAGMVIVLALASLIILNLYGYETISWNSVFKSLIVITVVTIASLLIYLFYYLFIKKDSNDKKDKRRVKPLN